MHSDRGTSSLARDMQRWVMPVAATRLSHSDLAVSSIGYIVRLYRRVAVLHVLLAGFWMSSPHSTQREEVVTILQSLDTQGTAQSVPAPLQRIDQR